MSGQLSFPMWSEDLAVPASQDLAHVPRFILAVPASCPSLSKMALSGFKLNSCPPYPFLSPHSTDEAARAASYSPGTLHICVLKQHTPSKLASHS